MGYTSPFGMWCSAEISGMSIIGSPRKLRKERAHAKAQRRQENSRVFTGNKLRQSFLASLRLCVSSFRNLRGEPQYQARRTPVRVRLALFPAIQARRVSFAIVTAFREHDICNPEYAPARARIYFCIAPAPSPR